MRRCGEGRRDRYRGQGDAVSRRACGYPTDFPVRLPLSQVIPNPGTGTFIELPQNRDRREPFAPDELRSSCAKAPFPGAFALTGLFPGKFRNEFSLFQRMLNISFVMKNLRVYPIPRGSFTICACFSKR